MPDARCGGADRALGLDAQTQSRLDELAEKANSGHLTEEERSEYEEYVDGMDLVGILKSKCARPFSKALDDG